MSGFFHHGFPLVPEPSRLRPNLFAIPFYLMKAVPAEHMLRQAQKRGLVNTDTVVIETSSGNFALGLALSATGSACDSSS